MGVQFSPGLRRLSVKYSCLQNVGELADIFPDPVHGPSFGDAWLLEIWTCHSTVS